jgi:hypothetical protein
MIRYLTNRVWIHGGGVSTYGSISMELRYAARFSEAGSKWQ